MENDSKNTKGITHNLAPSLVAKLQLLTADQLTIAEDIIDLMISRGVHSADSQRLQAERDKLLVDLGYALESIRQLLALNADLQQQLTNIDGLTIQCTPSAVSVAQRFLREMAQPEMTRTAFKAMCAAIVEAQ